MAVPANPVLAGLLQPPIPEDPKRRDEQMAERLRVAQAYAEVLGLNARSRTPAQKIVWDDFEKRGYMRRPTLTVIDGALCPLRLAQAEGTRIFHLDTMMILNRAAKVDLADKPKRKGRSIT